MDQTLVGIPMPFTPNIDFSHANVTGLVGGMIGGPNKAVQYNNAGAFGGEAAFSYDSATNILSVVFIDGQAITLSGDILVGDGTPLLPAFAFVSDPASGIFTGAGPDVSISVSGVQKVSFVANEANFSVTIIAEDGDVATPSIAFISDASYGFYYDSITDPALPVIGFAIEGNAPLKINRDNVVFTVPAFAIDGTDIAPAYSFANFSSTGIYASATSIIFGVNTNLKFTIDDTFVESTVPYYGAQGSSAIPTYSFTDNPDSGMFYDGTSYVGFAFDGDTVAIFDNVLGYTVGSNFRYLFSDDPDATTGTADVGIARDDPEVLRVDNGHGGYGTIAAQDIRVNNSVLATIPGVVVSAIEIFDIAGNSLGFLPVYDTIT